MPTPDYKPGDRVDVRSASPTWWPGVVTSIDDAQINVKLDDPVPNGNQWSGQILRYGGTSPVGKTIIWRAGEVVDDPSNQHIRPR